jgi:hypothetical protein
MLMFWLENALLLILPFALLLFRRTRYSPAGLAVASGAGVLGIGLHRANIAGIMLTPAGPIYYPTLFEIFISLGIIAAAVLVFLFSIERFRIWETKWEDSREQTAAPPEFDRASETWLGTPSVAGRTIYSLIFVIFLALGFAIIPLDRINSAGVTETPVAPARGGDTLFIDGNRDAYGVLFAHEAHIKRKGIDSSCVTCHHMNLPLDKESGCHACHRNMYLPADAFRHDWHALPDGGNIACNECHAGGGPRLAATAKQCDACHKDLIPAGAPIEVDEYIAPSYTDAMHGICIDCHRQSDLRAEESKNLARCPTCHNPPRPELPPELEHTLGQSVFNHLIVPEVDSSEFLRGGGQL